MTSSQIGEQTPMPSSQDTPGTEGGSNTRCFAYFCLHGVWKMGRVKGEGKITPVLSAGRGRELSLGWEVVGILLEFCNQLIFWRKVTSGCQKPPTSQWVLGHWNVSWAVWGWDGPLLTQGSGRGASCLLGSENTEGQMPVTLTMGHFLRVSSVYSWELSWSYESLLMQVNVTLTNAFCLCFRQQDFEILTGWRQMSAVCDNEGQSGSVR